MTVSELQDKFYDKLGFRRLEIYNDKMEDGRINVFITYCAMKVRLSARNLAWANRELKNKGVAIIGYDGVGHECKSDFYFHYPSSQLRMYKKLSHATFANN